MERDFERFRGGPTEPTNSRLWVSINRGRHLSFNRKVYELLGRPAAVHLYYSRERDAIGVEATSPRFNEAFPVMPNGTAGYRVSAAPFCRHFNISPDTTLKFLDPEITGQSMLLKLADTISVARPSRKK